IEQLGEWADRRLDLRELLGLELAEPRDEPSGAPRADAPEEPAALVGERQPDPALVLVVLRALDEAVTLEPVDGIRHRRRRDPLERRKPAHADPGRVLDADEQRDLLRRCTDLAGLAPKLAPHAEQHGPKPVRNRHPVEPGVRKIVNTVNDS